MLSLPQRLSKRQFLPPKIKVLKTTNPDDQITRSNSKVLIFFFMLSLKRAKRVLLVRDIAMYFLRVDTHRILLPENGVNHVRVD